jgi:hypothetical protein
MVWAMPGAHRSMRYPGQPGPRPRLVRCLRWPGDEPAIVWFTGFTEPLPGQPGPSAGTPQQQTSSEEGENAHDDGAGKSRPKACMRKWCRRCTQCSVMKSTATPHTMCRIRIDRGPPLGPVSPRFLSCSNRISTRAARPRRARSAAGGGHSAIGSKDKLRGVFSPARLFSPGKRGAVVCALVS